MGRGHSWTHFNYNCHQEILYSRLYVHLERLVKVLARFRDRGMYIIRKISSLNFLRISEKFFYVFQVSLRFTQLFLACTDTDIYLDFNYTHHQPQVAKHRQKSEACQENSINSDVHSFPIETETLRNFENQLK